jgi:hypothetical protein
MKKKVYLMLSGGVEQLTAAKDKHRAGTFLCASKACYLFSKLRYFASVRAQNTSYL